MPNKTIFDRLKITQQELEDIYAQEGSLKRTAIRIGCSKPTVIKYLRHIKKNPRSWKTRQHDTPILASVAYQDRIHAEIEERLLNKRVWMDLKKRRIPAGFIKGVYFELPDTEVPVVPLYTILRDGTRVVLLHIVEGESNAPTSPLQETPQEDDAAVALPETPQTALQHPPHHRRNN